MSTLLHGRDGESGVSPDSGEIGLASSLEDAPLFRGLSTGELDTLLGASSSHRKQRQHVVFCAGEKLAHLYVVQTGSFKLIRHSEEGKELIVALVRPGECFGALAEPSESRVLAQAVEDSTLLVIPLPAVRHTLAQNAEFAIHLLQHAQKRHEDAETAATRLAFETVPERLAHLLLEVSSRVSGELETPLNQTEIANLIGSSRETVCSILNQFRRQGLVELNRGRMRIVDRQQLDNAK